jgi:hypothetical protein
MSQQELLALLTTARTVLDRYLFEADGEGIGDDIAEICMAIDDALSDEPRVQAKNADTALERSAA